MKHIFTIMKKDLKRFFTDKRMLASLILPGVLIFIIYYAIGSIIPKFNEVDKDYKYQVYIEAKPDNEMFKPLFAKLNLELLEYNTKEEAMTAIKNEKADALIIFNGDFNDLLTPGNRSIEVYYNSVKKESAAFNQLFSSLFRALEDQMITHIYLVKSGPDYDLASDKDKSGMLLSTMLPYLLLVLLFTGCMAVVPESIAGEKERGTIAPLLVTPLKRTHLAIGKILSLSIVSMVSALSTFIGLVLSLPKLMQASNVGLSYGALDYIYTIFILISTVLLFVAILAIISAYSKSVKEASGYAAPVMILVVAVGMLSMAGFNASNYFLYLIPIYNVALALAGLLSFQSLAIGITITIVSNLVYSLILAFILSRMFNSERIMFN